MRLSKWCIFNGKVFRKHSDLGCARPMISLLWPSNYCKWLKLVFSYHNQEPITKWISKLLHKLIVAFLKEIMEFGDAQAQLWHCGGPEIAETREFQPLSEWFMSCHFKRCMHRCWIIIQKLFDSGRVSNSNGCNWCFLTISLQCISFPTLCFTKQGMCGARAFF